MKFGKQFGTGPSVSDEVTTRRFMKYFKAPETTFVIIQEPEDWVEYWEHFNPGGFPFPCTGERKTCPGCTSSNEKMKKASKRVAIQVLEGQYVNVYKFPITLADKASNRAQRIGTITDREYTIYKMQSKNGDGSTKTDYDIEGGDRVTVDREKLELLDVEAMLNSAYEEAWGEGNATETKLRNDDAQQQDALKDKVLTRTKRDAKVEPETGQIKEEPAPFEPAPDKVYSESELRQMTIDMLKVVCKGEGVDLPGEFVDVDKAVDWLLNAA